MSPQGGWIGLLVLGNAAAILPKPPASRAERLPRRKPRRLELFAFAGFVS